MENTTAELEVDADHCFEIGEVIAPGDTHLAMTIKGDTEQQANDQMAKMEALANSISDHCQVKKTVNRHKGSVTIDAMFDFDCTAEKMIFELYLR
ncbi:YfcZ/YiiS family protein [Endozoicomonas sp. SESOKO1]|uniref:YfcZ/YiiS family protein n=1 Tax=Endozoicomonas sp. SESOKO1 TaxID=2828742 RepID=UPI00214924D4|nr:YfcZ/YiiS family protein [Endozoicomonas sp. SESOKO1]